jgi:hypothetical protein
MCAQSHTHCGNERVAMFVCWRTDGTHPDASAAAIAAATDILGGVEGSLTGGCTGSKRVSNHSHTRVQSCGGVGGCGGSGSNALRSMRTDSTAFCRHNHTPRGGLFS